MLLLLLLLTTLKSLATVSQIESAPTINFPEELPELDELTEVSGVVANDTPDDKGKSVTIEWSFAPDDSFVSYYAILRCEWSAPLAKWDSVGVVARGSNSYEDKSVENGKKYWYKVRSCYPFGYAESEEKGPVVSSAQWFHHGRWNALILGIIICGLALFYIREARRGKFLFIRKISGLDAVDDAVGRATEMGRPILYLTGLSDMSDIATIASLSILSRVANRAAFHNTPLIVPAYEPVVMTAAQEVVKQAHLEVGRPDTYDESKIFYLTYDQFGYAAGVDGIMLRERPGAVFLQGYFFAESLILAETGASIGAIQIAGTPSTSQLPFFIVACDYTLIGEEMYAASTYLSREPTLLGSLKGEDYSKMLLIILIGIGVLLATLSGFGVLTELANKFINWFTFV